MNWTVTKLRWRKSSSKAGAFNVVPLIVAGSDDRAEQGSGFFVHPAVIVTAAHVVAPGRVIASSISVDCGNWLALAAAVAVPQEYLQGSLSAIDLAVVWVGESLCTIDDTVLVGSMADGERGDGAVIGWGRGAFGRRDVVAARERDSIRYQVEDLPGFSGGPLLVPRPAAGDDWNSVGVHFFHDDEGGLALPLDADAVTDAMRLFGLHFG
jgi:hypothetical protein